MTPKRRDVEEVGRVLTLSMTEYRPLRAKIERLVVEYAEGVGSLGLVKSLLLVADCNSSRAYIFNVLKRDVAVSDLADVRFAELTGLGDDLEQELEEYLDVEISLLNPSEVKKAKRSLKEGGIETATIRFNSKKN